MIYEVKVRVVQEGTVFVEAKTQAEAKKAATSNSVVSKTDFADTIEYYADEIYNGECTVDRANNKIIKTAYIFVMASEMALERIGVAELGVDVCEN